MNSRAIQPEQLKSNNSNTAEKMQIELCISTKITRIAYSGLMSFSKGINVSCNQRNLKYDINTRTPDQLFNNDWLNTPEYSSLSGTDKITTM